VALLTGSELQARPGMPCVDIAEAEELARAASNAIEAEVGPVEAQTSDLELPGNWSHRLKVNRRPLTAVTAAAIDGVDIDVSKLVVMRSGVIVRRQFTTFTPWLASAGQPHWGGPDVLVGLTVQHGWAAGQAPAWLVDLAADLARRAASNPTGVTQESVGSYSVSYGDTGSSVRMTRVERLHLRRRFGLGVGHF
jgi:hypothetical protein